MAKNRNLQLNLTTFLAVFLLVAGLALFVLYLTLPYFNTAGGQSAGEICLWCGAVLACIGFFSLVICLCVFARERSKREKNKADVMQDAIVQLDDSATYNGSPVRYIPNGADYDKIELGRYQSIDEKFDQIARMDKTQFVVYVAGLFGNKGYRVKLTPVLDNYGIDMIVEKSGTSVAVGCLLSDKVLCQQDIMHISRGKNYFNARSAMALTNMYFDKTALDYAKAEKMALVDRTILAQDFMR